MIYVAPLVNQSSFGMFLVADYIFKEIIFSMFLCHVSHIPHLLVRKYNEYLC